MTITVAVQEHRIDWVADEQARGGIRQVLEPAHTAGEDRYEHMITVCGTSAEPGETCIAENGIAGMSCGLEASIDIAREGVPVLLPLCPGHFVQHRAGRPVRLSEAAS